MGNGPAEIIGQGRRAEIEGRTERTLRQIRSEAYETVQAVKGKADAEATAIYANTYGKSPEFYNYLRTLETYKTTLDPSTFFILSTDSKYLKFLEN